MKRLSICLMIGLVLSAYFLAVNPGKAKALDENNCLSCHGKPGLVQPNGYGKEVSLFVSENNLKASAHKYTDCTTCHTSEPHKVSTPLTKLSLAEKCGTCHQYEYKLHLQSIHGQQLHQNNPDVATCVDCHSPQNNPHYVIRVLEYDAPAYQKNVAETCAKCHNNQELMADYGIVEKVYESYLRSFHGKAIQLGTYEKTQLDEATCINCHGYHDIKNVSDPNSPVAGLDNLAKTCEQCHAGAGVQFAASFLGHKEASIQHLTPVLITDIVFRVILITLVAFAFIFIVTAIVRFTLKKWRE